MVPRRLTKHQCRRLLWTYSLMWLTLKTVDFEWSRLSFITWVGFIQSVEWKRPSEKVREKTEASCRERKWDCLWTQHCNIRTTGLPSLLACPVGLGLASPHNPESQFVSLCLSIYIFYWSRFWRTNIYGIKCLLYLTRRFLFLALTSPVNSRFAYWASPFRWQQVSPTSVGSVPNYSFPPAPLLPFLPLPGCSPFPFHSAPIHPVAKAKTP